MTTTTMLDAANQLVSEGYPRDDVHAAIDSLIDAGIEEWSSLTDDEIGIVRTQLGVVRSEIIRQDSLLIYWDDYTDPANGVGWVVEVLDADGITLTDSGKIDFPVRVDTFNRAEVGGLLAALDRSYPDVPIDLSE